MHEPFEQRRYLIPFRGTLLPQIFCDTLIVGGGAAGLRAAINASEHGDVILLTKGSKDTSSTSWAQGGIAGVMTEADSVEAHVRDTLEAGAGLCDAPVVERIVRGARQQIEDLLSWGMRLDRNDSGELVYALEGGHSSHRIVHAGGDATGHELSRTLWLKALSTGTRVFNDCFALDLLSAGSDTGSPCLGAITYHERFGLQIIWARSTILAGGGAGVLWRETTNPPVSTGDCMAMAYRAGATLADMAFEQFHPTTLYIAGGVRSLISEAVRGEGATLVDRSCSRFMADAHPRKELAPRDVVARNIVTHLGRTGDSHVFLDARSIENFEQRFPSITEQLRTFELDPSRDLIPVHPAAHYTIGGVRTDIDGRTDVPGLYAVGECACSGLHGANRLASNSLLEGLVMGAQTGMICAEMCSPQNPWGVSSLDGPVRITSEIPSSERGELDMGDVQQSLRSAMWRNAGVERTRQRLDDLVDMLSFWGRYCLDKVLDEPDGWETQNLLMVGSMVARSAQWRVESRGCHWRQDAPDSSDQLRAHDLWRRGDSEPRLDPVDADTRTSAAHT
ncbi:MAG: L-aspartate oxidase [Planctomycetota bacterium]|jgi:L-aspartate oxidase